MYGHERSLVKQLANKPFALIGVNSDQDLDEIREIVKEKKLVWRNFQNEKGIDGKISVGYAVEGWPTLLVIDAKGIIRWKGHSSEEYVSVIEELLGEMGHDVTIKSAEKDSDGTK